MRSIMLVVCLSLVGCSDGPIDKRVNLPGEARRDERREARQEAKMVPVPPAFDYAAYRSVTDCLNAAAREGVDLNPCDRWRPKVRRN